jgi:COMPASS component SWD3
MPNDKNVFFSGGWDSTVHVWDVRVGTGSMRKIPGPSVSADSLDYRKGVLLAGNYQNKDIVQLYEFGSGKLMETLDIKEPHNSNSYCFTAAFAQRSEHEMMAVGLTGSNTVKVFLHNQVASTIKFQAAPLSLDFYRIHNKDYLVVGGLEGTIYAIRVKVRT